MLRVMLAALALASLAAPSDLLPPLPDGWQREKIPLPLPFAPELDYAGREELAFAPGMFEPESSSHFSYALVIALEGDVRIDVPFLEHFLTLYFRGLCGAVAADRALELDLDAIAADVRQRSENGAVSYVADVRLFDAFHGGAPLALALELEVLPLPGRTELFGLASPQPADAPIWSELRELRDAWRASRDEPVFLDTVEIAVDAETYAALVTSPLVAGALLGRRTRVSFHEGSGPGAITFAVERRGALGAVAAALAERAVALEGGAGERVQRFALAGAIAGAVLEHEPSPHEPGAEPASIRREDARRRELATRPAPAGPTIHDVVEVRLALDEAESEQLARVALAFGYERSDADGVTTWQAPQARFVVEPAGGGRRGVTRLDFELHELAETREEQLGSAVLSVTGSTASLELGDS